MTILALLLAATLFGGMVFFSFGFAPVLFAQLPMEKVRPLLRGTFPYYYAAIIALSSVSTAAAGIVDQLAGIGLAIICLTTVYARQILMGQINAATDADDQTRFKRLHGLSVVIQLVQIGIAGWVLIRIA